MTARALASALVTVTATVLFGCGGGSSSPAEGKPTESVCPTTQTLTYASFGQGFFGSYCQGCHASTVTGAARKGAPADHVFDQVEDIRLLAEHIDELAGAGPAVVNTVMPPDDPKPSENERTQLGEWLACGAP